LLENYGGLRPAHSIFLSVAAAQRTTPVPIAYPSPAAQTLAPAGVDARERSSMRQTDDPLFRCSR
jgi:hypothetical protein